MKKYENGRSHFGIPIKNWIKYTIYCHNFLPLHKKVDKFQLCLKTTASLFSFSWMTFLIADASCLNTP
jgi:hypothetical protein